MEMCARAQVKSPARRLLSPPMFFRRRCARSYGRTARPALGCATANSATMQMDARLAGRLLRPARLAVPAAADGIGRHACVLG